MAESHTDEENGGNLLQEVYDQFLICKICFEPYRYPKTLSCMHVFCTLCLERHQEAELERSYRYLLYSRAISCPICRKKTELPPGGVRRLQDSFLVSNLTEVINRCKPGNGLMMCEICTVGSSKLSSRRSSATQEAVSKCLECCKLLCFRCVRAHKRVNVTKGHSLYDISVEKDIECKVHNNELIRYYCEDCEECICVLCMFQEHKNHDVTSFADGIQKYQLSMEMMVKQCKSRIGDIKQQLDIINKCENELKATEEHIRDQSMEAMATVRRLQQEMTQDLHRAYGDEAMSYLKRKGVLQDALETLVSACKLTDIVMNDRSIEILLMRKQMQNKLQVSLKQQPITPPKDLFKDVKFQPHPFSFGYLDVQEDDDEDEYQEFLHADDKEVYKLKTDEEVCKDVYGMEKYDGHEMNKLETRNQSTNTMSWRMLVKGLTEYHKQESVKSKPQKPASPEHHVQSPGVRDGRTAPPDVTVTSAPPAGPTVSSSVAQCEQATDTVDLRDQLSKTTSTPDVSTTHCGTTTDGVLQVNRSTHTPTPETCDKLTSTLKIVTINQHTMTPLSPIMLDIGVTSHFPGEDKAVGTKAIVLCDTGTGDSSAITKDQCIETAWNGMIVPTREQASSTRVIVFSRSTSTHGGISAASSTFSLMSEDSSIYESDSSISTTDAEFLDCDSEYDVPLNEDLYKCPFCQHEIPEPYKSGKSTPVNTSDSTPTSVPKVCETKSTEIDCDLISTSARLSLSNEALAMSMSTQNTQTIISVTPETTGEQDDVNVKDSSQDYAETHARKPVKRAATKRQAGPMLQALEKQFCDKGTGDGDVRYSRCANTVDTFTEMARVEHRARETSPIRVAMCESGCNTDTAATVDKSADVQPTTKDCGMNTTRIYSYDTYTETMKTPVRNRGSSPIRITATKETATSTVPVATCNKMSETNVVELHDMATDSICFRGDDKSVTASVDMVDKQLDAFRLDTSEKCVATTTVKMYNSGTSMDPITVSHKETLTTKIHMMNKNTSTENAAMVDKQTSTQSTDVTAAYRGVAGDRTLRTITRGTCTPAVAYTNRETSPVQYENTSVDRGSSPVKVRCRDKATHVDKADLVTQDKFQKAGDLDDTGQPVRKAPSLETIREDSKESSFDAAEEDDLFIDEPPTSVALSSAISTILTHIESFCATSFGKPDPCQSTFSTCTNRPNVSSILCRVEQGTSTNCVETKDKAISTESVSVDGKMAECITKLKTVRQRLEQQSTASTGCSGATPLYSKANTAGPKETTTVSMSSPIATARPTATTSAAAAATENRRTPKVPAGFGAKLTNQNQLTVPFASPPLQRKQGGSQQPAQSPRSKARKQRLDMSRMLCTGPELGGEMPLMKTKTLQNLSAPSKKVAGAISLGKPSLKESKTARPAYKTKREKELRSENGSAAMQRSCSDESLPRPARAKLTREALSLDYAEYELLHISGSGEAVCSPGSSCTSSLEDVLAEK